MISKDLVNGLLKLKFVKDKVCEACQKSKKIKINKNYVSINRPLELYMDMFVFE